MSGQQESPSDAIYESEDDKKRLLDRLLQTVLCGDVMEVIESGGKFVVEDAAREQSRLDEGQLAVTGPMFGVKMLTPVGIPAERESQLLNASGIKLADFTNYSQLLSGARRAFSVRPDELTTTVIDGGIRFEFSLPTGTYATMLLREFLKTNEQATMPDTITRTDDGDEADTD